jgi:pimeloyl-ACP methyl ester carboxylesterase
VDDLPALHAQIAVPTQLIWGSKDGLFPIQRARRMSSEFRLPACFIEIPGGKAFLHEDMPAQYVAASLPFLTRHAGGDQWCPFGTPA